MLCNCFTTATQAPASYGFINYKDSANSSLFGHVLFRFQACCHVDGFTYLAIVVVTCLRNINAAYTCTLKIKFVVTLVAGAVVVK